MVNNRELLIAALTQMIAPRLFVLSGDNPETMGFPFADSKPEFDERMERQFNPVDFWTGKARKIAEAVVDVIYRDADTPDGVDAIVARSAEYAAKWQPSTGDSDA